ncbi:MAG TPA: putative porin [Candidatus Coprenecus pullicola]|nr:putative porin [Candidatus Coprenecus pullicola]
MSKKGFRDILCACVIILMLPCSAFIIRGMSMPYDVMAGVPQDSLSVQADSVIGQDSMLKDSLAGPDSLVIPDSLSVPDSSVVSDSLLLPDSLAAADSLTQSDSTAADSVKVLTKRELKRMAKDSVRKVKDAYKDSVAMVKQHKADSIHHIKDRIRTVKDSIRWSRPRVLETVFLPDSLYYDRIISWTTGTRVNEYRHADMDTTFNDWYTEYPFYKEDIDAVYLGTVGSAVQNVNFFKRREFDIFKAYAPYITYSHTPENMPFFNTKAPYTELAYWGTIFAFKDKEETNVRFMHTQNITPAWNLAVLFQGWKAAGILQKEATANNSLEVTTNYLGKRYVMNAGFIHHNIDREENGGIQDSYMVRDTTVDAKTIAVNLQNARNKLSRNTFFINHSYDILLESDLTRMRKVMDKDSVFTATVDSLIKVRKEAYERSVDAAVAAVKAKAAAEARAADSLAALADSTAAMLMDTLGTALDSTGAVLDSAGMSLDSAGVMIDSAEAVLDSVVTVVDTASAAGTAADSLLSAQVRDSLSAQVPDSLSSVRMYASPEDSIAAVRADSIATAVADSLLRASIMDTLRPPTEDEIIASLADSLLFGQAGNSPRLTVGHIGEVSRFYRFYTDEITDEVGRNFYNNMFYLNPTTSADSMRMFTVENKLFFRLQPWKRDAIVSEISGGVGYQWNSIYAFRPDMFLTGNRNINQHNMYLYAGASGEYKKYLNWGATAQYSFLGYYQNDFNVDAHVGVSFYPFKDKSEPITLNGRFSTSLKEPDWFSQHYYSNHYIWDNDFGKTSTTKVEASLDIPKWDMEAYFGYALVNNYLYNDTLGIARQNTGLINVMSAYLRKDFKIWWFHLDNQILFQYSSDMNTLPLPMLTFHLRYYIEMEAVKNVLTVQLGADARMNTPYYVPAYNPALGTFQLQTREQVGYNPYIDIFLNLQWKRVNIFLKVINVGEGWPTGASSFSAYHYVRPSLGFKFGIHWPFYIE